VRYYVTLDPSPGAQPIVVDVQELPSGALEVRLPTEADATGAKVAVDVVPLAGALSARIDGRVVDLTTEWTPPEIGAIASGHRSYVRVESERQRAADHAKKAKGGASDKVVKSPMPGRVVKVLVKAGDIVEAGEPLVVVEAMKMENELKAKMAGRISEVHVTAGTAVEGNAKLLTYA
jgi:biotin carboxyl carrier protein